MDYSSGCSRRPGYQYHYGGKIRQTSMSEIVEAVKGNDGSSTSSSNDTTDSINPGNLKSEELGSKQSVRDFDVGCKRCRRVRGRRSGAEVTT